MDIKIFLLVGLKLGLDSFLFMLNLYIAIQHMLNEQGGIGWFVAAGLWLFNICLDIVNIVMKNDE